MFNATPYIVDWISLILTSMGGGAETRMNLLDLIKRCSSTPEPQSSLKRIYVTYHNFEIANVDNVH